MDATFITVSRTLDASKVESVMTPKAVGSCGASTQSTLEPPSVLKTQSSTNPSLVVVSELDAAWIARNPPDDSINVTKLQL